MSHCQRDQRAAASRRRGVPAVEVTGYDTFWDALRDVIEPMEVDGLEIRIDSEFGCIVGDVAGD